MNRCVGSYNTIDDPYGKTCFANDIENIEKHKICGCKCKQDKDTCNNKQIWDKEACKCKCKKINTKKVCDSEFIWNPSVSICECNTYCHIYEYLDHEISESLTEKCEKILMKLWILFHQVIIIKHLILVLYV